MPLPLDPTLSDSLRGLHHGAIMLPLLARSLVASILALAIPTTLVAQGETYFQSLTVPPQGVGTCLAIDAPAIPRAGRLREQQLVMKAREPAREREISVYHDAAGRAVRFAELGIISTGSRSADAFGVVATIDTAGQVRGVRTQHSLQMASDGGFDGIDRAAMRAMRESATTRASNKPLDALAQRQVRELVQWMRTRCGG